MKTGVNHHLVIEARNEHHIGDEYAGAQATPGQC